MVYCSKCGTQNEEEAKFCVKCGAELYPEKPREKREEFTCFGPREKRVEEECFGIPYGGAIVGEFKDELAILGFILGGSLLIHDVLWHLKHK